VEGPPGRNDLLCASSSSLSLSPPALNPPQVEEEKIQKTRDRMRSREICKMQEEEGKEEEEEEWRSTSKRNRESCKRERGTGKDFSGRNKKKEISPLLCRARPTALCLFI
jgi:hypothetical protein